MSTAVTAPEDDAAAQRLRLGLLRVLASNNIPAATAIPILGLILAALFVHWTEVTYLVVWWVAAVGTTLAFVWVCRRILRPEVTVSDVAPYTRTLLALGFVKTTTWASLAFIVWEPGDSLNNMQVFTFLCASVVTVALIQSPSLPIAAAHLAAYLFTLSSLWFTESAVDHALFVAGFAVLTVFIGVVTYNNHRTVRDVLILREEKNDLIGALNTAKSDSDAARQKAESASRAKSDFLANMSHELRTPLNAIIGFSELIKDEILGSNKAETYCSYADDIHSSGHHLLGLINDILDLSKIEAGRYVVYDEPLLLSESVRDVVRLFKSRCEKQGVALGSELNGEPLLMADRRAVKQILINLVGNAIKFTDAGGTIDVRVAERDGATTIAIADTGRGIAPNDLKHVFESFGQGRHDVTIRDKGTGLGLSIVKSLVDAHGGAIELDSALGRGTTVTVVFPVERTLKPARSSQAA